MGITLFSMTNVDIIRETYSNIMDAGSFIAQVYLYSFISLFIYVVLSVFIVIMELAYEELHPMEGVEWSEQKPTNNNQNDLNPSEAIVHSNVLVRSYSSTPKKSLAHPPQFSFTSPTQISGSSEVDNIKQHLNFLESPVSNPFLAQQNSIDSNAEKLKNRIRLILNASHCSFIEDMLKCIPETKKTEINSSNSENENVIMSRFKACQSIEYTNMQKEMLCIIASHYHQ